MGGLGYYHRGNCVCWFGLYEDENERTIGNASEYDYFLKNTSLEATFHIKIRYCGGHHQFYVNSTKYLALEDMEMAPNEWWDFPSVPKKLWLNVEEQCYLLLDVEKSIEQENKKLPKLSKRISKRESTKSVRNFPKTQSIRRVTDRKKKSEAKINSESKINRRKQRKNKDTGIYKKQEKANYLLYIITCFACFVTLGLILIISQTDESEIKTASNDLEDKKEYSETEKLSENNNTRNEKKIDFPQKTEEQNKEPATQQEQTSDQKNSQKTEEQNKKPTTQQEQTSNQKNSQKTEEQNKKPTTQQEQTSNQKNSQKIEEQNKTPIKKGNQQEEILYKAYKRAKDSWEHSLILANF